MSNPVYAYCTSEFCHLSLQTRIDQVEHEIRDIQQTKEDEQNEIEGTGTGSGSDEEDDDDKYDQTYEEKVRKNRVKSWSTSNEQVIYFIGSPRWHCGPHQPHLVL